MLRQAARALAGGSAGGACGLEIPLVRVAARLNYAAGAFLDLALPDCCLPLVAFALPVACG
jgi:hypothetical protein